MGPPHLDVAVLGPVEVRRDGVPLSLPPGRPTVILAALAVRVGTIVPVDVLAGYLWPDDEPQRPRATIQTHVARLRAILGRDVVTAAGGGYRLQLPTDAVDVSRFRNLVATDTDADPASELDHLERALSLWRGAPLAGLTPDALEMEAAPLLVEELLAATERRNDVRLRLGRFDEEFIPEVRRLVSAHPWRERLWGQLMLVLYRQNRRGEALSAYREVVDVLREQLGIDPGPELADLHRRMLESDPGLLGSPPGSSAATVPSQLPRSAPDFVGRDDEVDALTSGMSAERPWARVAVVSGPGGTGKTTLALRVGHALRGIYPDGQLFAELRGSSSPARPADVLGDFLTALGLGAADVPADVDDRAALFRSVCAGKRLLVVLDDAHEATHITSLLPGVEGCGALVTSRPPLGVVSADVHVDLGELGEGEARSLLAAIAGPARIDTEPDAVDAVVQACQGLPLALRIAGGRLASRPSWNVADLARRLRGESRLDVLEIGELSIRATITASLQALSRSDAERFTLLAAMPGSTADVEAAAVAWGASEVEARGCLERLVDARLVDSGAPDEYRWHDLVDDYVRASASADDVHDARRTLTRYYLRSVYNGWPVLRPDSEATEDAPWFPHDVHGRTFANQEDLHSWLHPRWTFLTSLGHQVLRGTDQAEVDEAAALLLIIGRSGYECCRDIRIESLARTVLNVPTMLGDRQLVARAWHGLGIGLGAQHRREEAVEAGTSGLAVWRELGDRYGEVITLHNMAVWHEAGRHYVEAAELFEECAHADDVLSPRIRARCRRNLADVQVSLKQFDLARRNLEWAWAENETHLDVDLYDHAMATAHLCCARGEFDEAFESYDEAVAMADRLGSATMRAETLAMAARAHRQAGHEVTVSAAAATEALTLAREVGRSDAEGQALTELGHADVARGDVNGATERWAEALMIYESIRSVEADDVRTLLAGLP